MILMARKMIKNMHNELVSFSTKSQSDFSRHEGGSRLGEHLGNPQAAHTSHTNDLSSLTTVALYHKL